MNFLVLGFIFSSTIGIIGYKKHALTKSGIIGAIITGTLIFGFGQRASWYLPFIVFFVSSSLLSAYRKKDKDMIAEVFEKTGRRDIWQALANGGWPAILSVLGYYLQDPWVYVGFAAAIATVNADTWATEIGVLSKTKPRFILTGKQVERGTSGGISLLGLLGSTVGAFLITLTALLLLGVEGTTIYVEPLIFIAIVIFSGLMGSLFDSFFGATIQAQYQCTVCGKATEKKEHCRRNTAHYQGLKWMNNDMVNFLSSVLGSGVGVILFLLL